MPLRQKIGLLPKVQRISLTGLSDLIVKGGYEPLLTALGILNLARSKIGPDAIAPTDNAYHIWGVGALVLAALSLPHEVLPEGDFPVPPARELEKLLLCAAGLSSEERIAARSDEEFAIETRLSLLRILAQSSVQGDAVTQIYRTLYLLELTNEDGMIGEVSYYDGLFVRKFGGTAIEFLTVLFALYAASLRSNIIDLRNLFAASESQVHLTSLCRAILVDNGFSHDEARHLTHEEYGQYRAEGLIHAVFSHRPFIRLDEHRWILPMPTFSHFVSTSGPIFTTLEIARQSASSKGSDKPWTNEHSTRMGRRFEGLVLQTLRSLTKPENLVTEYEYLDYKKTDLSPDFLVFDTDGSLLLIQAKLKRLAPGAFFGFDLGALESDARGPLAETVWKTIRYLFRLDKAAREHRLRPGTESLASRVLTAPRILLLGIVPAMPAVFRVREFRAMIEEGVAAHLQSDETAWWKGWGDRMIGWHLVDWSELAICDAISRGRTSPFSQLSIYLKEMEHRGGLIVGDGFFPSFRDWLILRNRDPQPQPSAIHSGAFHQLLSMATSILALTGKES